MAALKAAATGYSQLPGVLSLTFAQTGANEIRSCVVYDTMASLEANGPALKDAVAGVVSLLAEGGKTARSARSSSRRDEAKLAPRCVAAVGEFSWSCPVRMTRAFALSIRTDCTTSGGRGMVSASAPSTAPVSTYCATISSSESGSTKHSDGGTRIFGKAFKSVPSPALGKFSFTSVSGMDA